MTRITLARRDRRRAILMAALECFTTRGVIVTTIAEIRAKASASIGSLYHHFGSKEALAAELYLEGLREYQRGFVARLRRHRRAEDGIKGMVAYHVDWVRKHQAWARYLLHMREAEFLLTGEEGIRALNQGFSMDLRAWLAPHVKAETVVDLPVDLLLAIVLGPAQMLARQWLAGRASITPEDARRVLARAAWNALRGPGGRASRGGPLASRRPGRRLAGDES